MFALKQTSFFLLLLVSRHALGQSTCVESCTEAAAVAAGCSSTSSDAVLECICTSSLFTQLVVPCIETDCTSADLQEAEEEFEEACSGSGSSSGGLSSGTASRSGGLSSSLPTGSGLNSGILSSLATATAASTNAGSGSTATTAASNGEPTIKLSGGASRIASGFELHAIAGLVPAALWLAL